mmetsp:Transcript_44243/g.114371  ORF Transcript_44243/g.114371 Transcript_44243/m.114371 type:complete len:252 (-) Transcript_44243:151-906(-)
MGGSVCRDARGVLDQQRHLLAGQHERPAGQVLPADQGAPQGRGARGRPRPRGTGYAGGLLLRGRHLCADKHNLRHRCALPGLHDGAGDRGECGAVRVRGDAPLPGRAGLPLLGQGRPPAHRLPQRRPARPQRVGARQQQVHPQGCQPLSREALRLCQPGSRRERWRLEVLPGHGCGAGCLPGLRPSPRDLGEEGSAAGVHLAAEGAYQARPQAHVVVPLHARAPARGRHKSLPDRHGLQAVWRGAPAEPGP